jgi:hypothetical protein
VGRPNLGRTTALAEKEAVITLVVSQGEID